MRSCCMQAPDFCMIRHTAKHPVEYTLFRMSSDNPSRPYNPSLLLTWQCMPTSSGNLNADAHRQCLDTHLCRSASSLSFKQRCTGRKEKNLFFFCGGSQLFRAKRQFSVLSKKSQKSRTNVKKVGADGL